MSTFQIKDTDSAKTSTAGKGNTVAKVYSTDEFVRVEFASADTECGAWLTPTQVNELIQLLQAVFVEEAAA